MPVFLRAKWGRIFEIETVLENWGHMASVCMEQAVILKVQIHALLFSAPVNSKQPSFLAWGSLHWSPEPNSTRQDVSRVSLTKRKGPALVMFKSAVFALSDSSLPSPPCSLYQNGYIRSTLAFCLQLKVDQWEVPPRRQEREELGVLISWFPSCGFTITKDCLLHGSPHTTFSGIQ